MITDRNLKLGTRLTATHKGKQYSATVGEIADESPIYTVTWPAAGDFIRKDSFKSLSKAAMAITGNSVNGWRFWTVDGGSLEQTVANAAGAVLADQEKRARARVPRAVDRHNAAMAAATPSVEAATPPEPKRRGRKPIHVLSFLKGDHTRYWCAACQEAYPIEVGALIPDACPKGHRDDDPELTAAPTITRIEEELSALATAAGEFNIDNMTPHSESSRFYDDPATDR